MEQKKAGYTTRLENYLYAKADKQKIPLSGTFELSPLCNFDCKMCYIKMTPEKMKQTGQKSLSLAEWISIADQAKEAGMLYLLLTGGEPLLWPDFWKLYEYLSKQGFVISINSNGSLINEEAVARFREMPPSKINITLYGASDETYGRLCGNSSGFQKTVRAIEALTDAGILVKLNGSMTPYNIGDFEKLIEYAREKKLLFEASTYMYPPVRNNPESVGYNDRFTPEEAAYWHLQRFRLQNGQELYPEYLRRIAEGMVDPVGLDESCYDPCDGTIKCRAGKASFWITWDGRMLPCGMMPATQTDVRNGFGQAWSYICEETEKIKVSGICSRCENYRMCHPCVAVAATETGRYDGIPRYRCEMMQAMKKIAKEQLKIYGES